MPSDYTVEEVTPAEQWSNDYGQFQPYDLKLAGMDSTVQLNRKLKDGAVPEAKVPKPGQTLFLSINGDRAKEEQRQEGQQAMPQGSSPASGNGDDPYARRADHPDNAARARHSTAIGATPGFYEFFITCGVLPKPDSLEKAKATAEQIVKWLESTYPVGSQEAPF